MIKLLLTSGCFGLLLTCGTSFAGAQEPPVTLAARITAVLNAEANGHSPSPEELQAAENPGNPAPDATAVQAAVPGLLKALSSPDSSVRAWALHLLSGLEQAPARSKLPPTTTKADPTSSTPAADQATPPDESGPTSGAFFPPAIAKALGSVIPALAARLTDEEQTNRLLAAAAFHGFTGSATPEVYRALTAYLQRDDSIGEVGQSVAEDLLALGPVSNQTAAVIARYLRRSDQPNDGRATLIDTLSTEPNQNQLLNQVALIYLDSDDPGIRSRLILSLPLLDLPPEVFATTKTRLQTIQDNEAEPLPVRTAAKNVAGCWTKIRMPSGCPTY